MKLSNRKIIQAKVIKRKQNINKNTKEKGIIYVESRYIGCEATIILHLKKASSDRLS